MMRSINACLCSDRAVVILVVILTLVVQGTVAVFHSKDFSSPNAASWIARSLANRGIYEGGWWYRLRGPEAVSDAGAPRMFHLPGEPLYTAAGFKLLPESLWRFLHVPVTALLIGAASWWGLRIGGRVMGLLTGFIGALYPFVLLHGVVWDDIFLSAALDWLAAGIVLAVLVKPPTTRMPWPAWLGVFAATGYTVITRAASQVVFGALAICLLVFRSLRSARLAAIAILLGMAISLGMWGLRNRAVTGQFFIGSTHDGITLWESNYPYAAKALLERGAIERMDDERMTDDYAITRHMGELEANKYFLHRAYGYIFAHPFAVARTGIIKIMDDLTGVEFPSPWTTTRNLVSVISNGLIILLALPAFWKGRICADCIRPVRTWFWAVFWAQFISTTILLFIGPNGIRYWMSVQPIFWMADAWTITHIFVRRHRQEVISREAVGQRG